MNIKRSFKITITLIALTLMLCVFTAEVFAADVMIRTSSTEAKNGEHIYIRLDMMQNSGFSLMKINLGFM